MFDPRKLLAIGFLIGGITLLWLSQLSLQAGYWDIFWPQMIQGASLSLLFVPLTTAAMAVDLAREDGQRHQPVQPDAQHRRQHRHRGHRHDAGAAAAGGDDAARIARHGLRCRPASRCSRRSAPGSSPPAPIPVTATNRTYAALFGTVWRQASMVSFVTIFQILGLVFIALIPLVLIMKRPAHQAPPPPMH